MAEEDALEKIMIPAFDISYGMFGHGPPRKIRYLKIIFLLFRLYHTDDFNFTKAMDKIEWRKAWRLKSLPYFFSLADQPFFPGLLHIVFQIDLVLPTQPISVSGTWRAGIMLWQDRIELRNIFRGYITRKGCKRNIVWLGYLTRRFYNLCEEKNSDTKIWVGIKVFRGLEIRLIDNFPYH